jgi:DNA-binding NarL/FixJ family response regulator
MDRMELLTPKQIEVARYVGRGMSNKLIARQLNLSEGAVKKHLQLIFAKMAVRNRTALAMLVARMMKAAE